MLGPFWQRFLPGGLAVGCAGAALLMGDRGDRLRGPLLAAALLLPLLSPWILHAPLRRLRERPRVELTGGALLLDGRVCRLLRLVGRDDVGRTVAVLRRGRRDVLGALPLELQGPPSPAQVALVSASVYPRGIALSVRILGLVLVLMLLSRNPILGTLVAWLLWPILVLAYLVLALDAFSFTPLVRVDPAPRAWVHGAWQIMRGPVRSIEPARGALLVHGAETYRVATTALGPAAVDRFALFLRDALSDAR